MKRNPDNLLTFYVNPSIPEKIKKLHELSYNLWSTWDKSALNLFNRIDPILYRKVNHNPVELLHLISDDRLHELSNDQGFLNELDSVYTSFKKYMKWKGSYKKDKQNLSNDKNDLIAYFSMEYGLHESIPIYSGGLGVLSGDYIKAASDQAIPLTAFGLLYKYGYFVQYIDEDGQQQEDWEENKWHIMPVKVVTNNKNENLIIKISITGYDVLIKVWSVAVGQITIYLLDTDIPENPVFIRKITDKLYDADRTFRLLQEIVLSFGSLKLMDELGLHPKVFHLNEGHSAFLIIERLYQLINNHNYSFEEAYHLIYATTVFTTHTPVAAGNEHFPKELVNKYLQDRIAGLKIAEQQFYDLAAVPEDDKNFWLPALAIRFSQHINGVSKMHSKTSRKMWKDLFPNLAKDEIPIDYVTNGVHTGTWLSKEMSLLFDRYIGEEYLHKAEESSVWQNVAKIPDIEIWEAHQRRKEQMISFIRQRIEKNIFDEDSCPGYAHAANIIDTDIESIRAKKRNHLSLTGKLKNTLSPDILTIGFARRFAPYKRANLILQDPERLVSIINNPEKPVQFVIAGKAHPADGQGKQLIKNLINFARKYAIEDRFVFIEDYDINVAKHLVQGVDVWLNTPIRPHEASGTSGMKAGVNGVINLSILDGWWPECYDHNNGWSIKTINLPEKQELADRIEANHIYDLIEGEISTIYYRRNESNIPEKWLQIMKNSIFTVGKGFNLHRMLREYSDKFYMPSLKAAQKLTEHSNKKLKQILHQEHEVRKYWGKVHIKDFHLRLKKKKVQLQNEDTEMPITTATTVNRGDTITANCYAYLGNAPEKLFKVEMFCKNMNKNLTSAVEMKFIERYEDNVALYRKEIKLENSGLQGVNVRIRANLDKNLNSYHQMIKWKQA